MPVGHQRLDRDVLVYCDLDIDCQRRAYDVVHEYDTITVFRFERRIYLFTNAFRNESCFAVSQWVWLYNTAPKKPSFEERH